MAIGRAFSLVTFPIVARNLSVAEYGTLDLFLVLASFLATLLVFGQDSAVGRFFYEYEDQNQRKQMISQSFLIQAGICCLGIGVLALFAERLASFIMPGTYSIRYLYIILLQLPFMVAINFSQNILKWTFHRRGFLVMSIGYSASQAGLLFITMLYSHVNIEVVLLVLLLTNTIFGLLGIFMVRYWLVAPRELSYVFELLHFALPIGVICVLGAAIPLLERQSIEKMLGVWELGLYAAGSKLAMLLMLIIGAFQTAWGPFSTSIHRESDAAQTYNLVLSVFSLVICVLVMILDSLAEPLLALLASDRYISAAVVVLPLGLAVGVQATGWITEIGISLSKKTTRAVYPHLIFIAVLISTMMILIPMFGLLGAALSLLIAQIIRCVVAGWLAQRAYPIPWSYSWTITCMAFTLMTGLFARGFVYPWGGELAMDMVYYLAAIGLCLYFLKYKINKADKSSIFDFVLGVTGRKYGP